MKKGLISLAFLLITNAHAKVNFIEALAANYPQIVNTPILDCMTCHTVSKWQRNDYGMDLQNYLRDNYQGDWNLDINYTRKFIRRGMKAIEHLDSDGDGFTNAEEFKALTNPGIAEDNPRDELVL